jgi:hypothetical protein
MNVIIEHFPIEIIELNKEVGNHPVLMDLLAEQPMHEFEIRLGVIAAYCEVILDGAYTREDILKLCDILTTKLKMKNVLQLSALHNTLTH